MKLLIGIYNFLGDNIMRLKSHLHIADITCKMIEEIVEVKLDRGYLKLGVVMPDILPNRRYQFHSPNKVYKHYEKELHRIISKNKRSKRISFIIGLLIHYITDAFCLSHNVYVSNIKKHVQYEHLLDEFKYDYKIPEDIIDTIKGYIRYLADDDITVKNYIEKMNEQYLKSINQQNWQISIENDIESAIIHVSSIISNFLFELKANQITAFAN